MTIKYNGKEITLKFSFRADMLFENITEHSFNGTSETDWIIYFFCTVLAITRDDDMNFDDFVDWLSDNQYLLMDFVRWYTQIQETATKVQRNLPTDESSDNVKSKKAKTRK